MANTDDEQQHCSEVFALGEGDDVTLVIDDGSRVDVTLVGKSRHHSEDGPHITEQTTLTFIRASDGHTLRLVKTDGLSGLPDVDPFPSHVRLHDDEGVGRGERIGDDDMLGYVREVEQ